MACAYFSREVARIHGSTQVTGQTNCHKRRGIYSADSSGRSCGHFGNRGRGRGRGFGRSGVRGCGGSHYSSIGSRGVFDFNGIDISNPTHVFTDKEWTSLGPGGGRAHFTQQRMMINGCGRVRDAGRFG